MRKIIIPKNYNSILSVKKTEIAIRQIKNFFAANLANELRLRKVTAPLFVEKGTGINDDLNGVEKPVSFLVPDIENITAEVVQSLAKWKRIRLADLGMQHEQGLYTDTNAIRPNEQLDNIHSLYVDQWDWERTIIDGERNVDFLKYIVSKIYTAIKRTARQTYRYKPDLPEKIKFIHSEELVMQYPNLSTQEREQIVCERYGAVFIMGIGGVLSDGKPHDHRAPDYDDWELNGDLIVWNPVLQSPLEISSMGIRVDKKALLKQLSILGKEDRKELLFHKRLLNDELPLSIGGGIGQSRLCMFLLRKAHIGEVQASMWPNDMINEFKQNNIYFLK